MHIPFRRRPVVLLLAAIACAALIPTGSALALTPTPVIGPPSGPTASRSAVGSLGNDMVGPSALVSPAGVGASRRLQAALPPAFPTAQSGASVQLANHTVDVAVVAPLGWSGSTAFMTDSYVSSLVDRTGQYWAGQSGGRIASLSLNPVIERYSSTNACSADPAAFWTEALAWFGRTSGYYNSAQSHHLLVLVPDSGAETCGNPGTGTVGTSEAPVSTSNGGAIVASVGDVNDLDIVAHEFGHNLGLVHSNVHSCPNVALSEGRFLTETTFSDGCADVPYEDAYDVMGAAFSVNVNGALQANVRPTALNVTHQDRLGVLVPGEVGTISLPAGSMTESTSAALVSTGSTTGERALKITDPLTGQIYYVDFRGGGGMDTDSLYESHYLNHEGMDVGVRVLTTRADGTSVVLLSPDSQSSTGHRLYLSGGQSLRTRSHGVRVTVQGVSGGVATVTITLSRVLPVDRLSGLDRFETSAAVSAANFSPGVPVVYLASGAAFPDALSGAPVAGKKGTGGAPVLLVSRTVVPPSVAAELARLRPRRIVILGGTGAVSASVEKSVQAYTAGTVSRISGADRYATSARISAVNFAPGVPVVYVANGRNFPDALSGAPVAGASGAPVLLVTATGIPASVQTELKRLTPGRVVVLGGTGAVSSVVEKSLGRYAAGGVTRLSGADRFATSAAISRSNFVPGVPVLYIANGSNFPDALSGAPIAGTNKAPVLLVSATSIPAAIAVELGRLKPGHIVVLGGTGSISAALALTLADYIP